MLRCPPSRIELNSHDISTFERRMAPRQSSRLKQPGAPNVRLSAGPARSTSLSLVPAEQNVGIRRAVSSSSEATIHEVDGGSHGGIALALNDADQCEQNSEALRSVLDRFSSRPSPRRQVDSYYGTGAPVPTRNSSAITTRSLAGLDGFTERGIPHSPIQVTCNLVFQPAQATPTDPSMAGAPIRHSPISVPQLLCSARARRRYRHVGTETPFTDSSLSGSFDQEALGHHHTQTIPDIVLPSTEVNTSLNPALDPGAPVFIPRTRFGTASSSSADGMNAPRWSSVDTTHSAIDLRIRSSSERNSNVFGCRLPDQVLFDVALGSSHIRSEVENSSRGQRQRSRPTDQNASFIGTANLERYPLFRPESPWEHQRWDTRLSPNIVTANHARSISPSTSHHEITTGRGIISNEYNSVLGESRLLIERAHLRSATPAMLRDTRSTPDLLHHAISPGRIYSRGSSLSWSRSASGIIRLSQEPRMVSAANGISGDAPTSTRDGLDAATEFLRMRSSPLDDLTERLSKLATSRASSLDRSLDMSTTSQRKVSLLKGDPFRADAHVNHRNISMNPLHRLESPAETKKDPLLTTSPKDTTLEDLVALSLALPPSSSLPSTPQVNKLSSPHANSSPTLPEPRTVMRDTTSRFPSSPPIAIKRKPVPTCKTPKVSVYDDSKPPHTQPQTREDLPRSTRRSKARSDISSVDSPLGARKAKPTSPPTISERHPHRHTHPSTFHGQSSSGTGGPSPVRASGTTQTQSTAPVVRNIYREQSSGAGLEGENEMQGHLIELEDDRRIWIDRQGAGPLDATPPKEGRYERYLS